MKRVLLSLALSVTVALAAPAFGATGVWSVDTSKLDLAALERLEKDVRLADWAEMGNRLLVVCEPGVARDLQGAGLRSDRLESLSDLADSIVVLSKHHGVLSILEGRAQVVAREGTFSIVRPTVPGLNRLLPETDHLLKLVPLARHAVIFRSAAHLPKVTEPDSSAETMVAAIDKSKYEATLKRLIDFKTRYSYSPNITVAANWAVDTFKSFGCDARIVPYTQGGRELPNVVAEIKGTKRPDEIYVVGAHLDSIAWESDKYAPGADDNGSGSAGVLEMARVLGGKKPEATLRFCLFSGEEQGIYGSIHYVEQLKASGELAKVKAMLNLDMISYDKTAPLDLMLEGKEISHTLSDRLQANATKYAPAVAVNRTDNAWGSDHISFLDEQVPATLTFEYEYDANGNEHSPRDVFEICNLDLAVAILKMDVGTLCELAGIR